MIISPSACRKLLGGSSSLSDTECELLLNQLTVLAKIAIEQFEDSSKRSPSSGEAFNEMLKLVPPDDHAYIHEKAIEIELVDDVDSDVAQRLALGEYIAWKCGRLTKK